MSDAEIVVGVRGDVSGGKVVKQTLDDIGTSGKKAQGATEALERQMKSLNSVAAQLKSTMGALGIAFGVKQLFEMADAYSVIERKIRSATEATGDFNRVNKELLEISMKTGTTLEDNTELFEKLSFAARQFGKTNQDVLQVQRAIQDIARTNASASDSMRAEAVMIAKSLADGRINAQEFGAVLKKIPDMAEAIAAGMGLTVTEMMKAIEQGRVLGSDVFTSLQRQAEEIEEKTSKIPLSMKQAMTNLETDMLRLLGYVNKVSHATEFMADAFKVVGVGAKAITLGVLAMFDAFISSLMEIGNYIQLIINTFILTPVNKAAELLEKIPGVGNVGRISLIPAKGVGDHLAESGKRIYQYANDIDVFGGVVPSDSARAASGRGKPAMPHLGASQQELDAIDNKLKSLVQSTQTWQEKIAELERLRPFAKTTEQLTAINRAIDKIRQDIEKDSPLGKAFASFASGIDDSFKKAFEDGFSGTTGGFRKMLDGMKASFMTFLADLAYMAMVRPILLSVVAGVGGGMGLSSGTVGSILGTTNGGASVMSGLSNLSSLSNISSLFGNNSFLTAGVDKIGSFFGMGNSSFIGPMANGGLNGGLSQLSSFTNGSFGGSLGAGIGGFGGNMLANALLGNRGIGSTIGGTLGTIAGSFIPVPILGPMIGGFLGNAIGGLFGGGKPANQSAYGVVDLASGERSKIGDFGANQSNRDNALNAAMALVSALKASGGSTTGSMGVEIGNRDGYLLANNNQRIGTWSDPKMFYDAMAKEIIGSTSGLNSTAQSIIGKVGTGDIEKLIQALSIGNSLDSFLSQDTANPLQQALDALDKQFAELTKQVSDIGLPIDKLTDAYEKQKKALTENIKAQQAGFTSMEQMTKSFKDFLNAQALGSDSSLSPMQKLELAQNNFGSLLAKAQGGDASVTPDVLKAGSDLLSVGRNVYASSVDFSALESFVRSSIGNIAKQLGVPGFATGTEYAPGGMAMVGERGRELRHIGRGDRIWSAGDTAGIMAYSGSVAQDVIRSNAQMISSISENTEVSREMHKELRQMRKQAERAATKKIVTGK